MKNLYTVDDVAKMTGLTGRTIHNYIRDGKLTGKKIGVQWRFTEEDIAALFKDKKVENDVRDSNQSIVLEFLEPKELIMPEACSIIDYPFEDKKLADQACQSLLDFVNSLEDTNRFRFSYQYMEEQNVARFIIKGNIPYVKDVLELINMGGEK